MEETSLVWRYLLAHPVAPWIVPAPWHLLVALAVLGTLAGLGVHHIFSVRYSYYRIHDKQDPVLSLASLLVVWISVFALLGAYLVGTQGERMVQAGLLDPTAKATASRMGQILLTPIFGSQSPDVTGGRPGTRGQVQALLMAVPAAEFRRVAGQHLEQVRGEITRLDTEAADIVEKGLPPSTEGENASENSAPGTEATATAEPSLPLLALALAWVTDPDQDWPAAVPEPTNRAVGSAPRAPGWPAKAAPQTEPEAGRPEAESPATQSAPKSDTPTPGEPGPTPTAPDEGATPGAEPAPAAEPPAQSAEKSDPFAPEESEAEEPEEFPLHILMTLLVNEIQEDALLVRQDWEHVAGNRFMNWVTESLMIWQVRYSAVLAAVVTLAANILYFFLLRIFRRWLNAVPQFEIRKTA